MNSYLIQAQLKTEIIQSSKKLPLYRTVLTLDPQSRLLKSLYKVVIVKPFGNIVGKGENAVNQHFLLFLQCFLPYQKRKIIILATMNEPSANAFNLERFRNLVKS